MQEITGILEGIQKRWNTKRDGHCNNKSIENSTKPTNTSVKTGRARYFLHFRG